MKNEAQKELKQAKAKSQVAKTYTEQHMKRKKNVHQRRRATNNGRNRITVAHVTFGSHMSNPYNPYTYPRFLHLSVCDSPSNNPWPTPTRFIRFNCTLYRLLNSRSETSNQWNESIYMCIDVLATVSLVTHTADLVIEVRKYYLTAKQLGKVQFT